jgi:hypothetical protein
MEQEKDPFIRDIRASLLQAQDEGNLLGRDLKKKLRAYSVQRGVVYRKQKRNGKIVNILYVPKTLRTMILSDMHDAVLAGHLGIHRTWNRMRNRFYWPRMYRDIVNYVQSCESCAAQKRSTRAPSGLLQPLPPVMKPFSRIAMDTLGPLTPSQAGNKYILVCTDHATRVAIARAVPDHSAFYVAKFLLEDVFLKYGLVSSF